MYGEAYRTVNRTGVLRHYGTGASLRGKISELRPFAQAAFGGTWDDEGNVAILVAADGSHLAEIVPDSWDFTADRPI